MKERDTTIERRNEFGYRALAPVLGENTKEDQTLPEGQMGTGYSGHYKNTQGSLKPEHLMEELRNRGNKFTEEEVVMVTRTQKGELVWLEQGDRSAGRIHIIERHKNDLERKYGITEEKIPAFMKAIFKDGIEVSRKDTNNGHELRYPYQDDVFVISAVGTNGYIITIYPDPKGGQ